MQVDVAERLAEDELGPLVGIGAHRGPVELELELGERVVGRIDAQALEVAVDTRPLQAPSSRSFWFFGEWSRRALLLVVSPSNRVSKRSDIRSLPATSSVLSRTRLAGRC